MAAKKRTQFDPQAFLSIIGAGRTVVSFQKKQTIYAQGDPCDAVFFVQKGKIKLTVVSDSGKEAIVGIWSDGDFFGEGCLVGQAKRIGTASAMAGCKAARAAAIASYRVSAVTSIVCSMSRMSVTEPLHVRSTQNPK